MGVVELQGHTLGHGVPARDQEWLGLSVSLLRHLHLRLADRNGDLFPSTKMQQSPFPTVDGRCQHRISTQP